MRKREKNKWRKDQAGMKQTWLADRNEQVTKKMIGRNVKKIKMSKNSNRQEETLKEKGNEREEEEDEVREHDK